MKRLMSVKKFFAFMVILSFIFMVASPGFSRQQTGSRVSGKILSSDKTTPVAGAIVKAAEIESKKVYESQPTTESGSYEISGLPKGTYDIAVQAEKGLYAVNKLLDVGMNESLSLSLALNENAENPGMAKGENTKEAKAKPAKTGFWNNPLTATLTLVGIAIVVGLAIDELTDEEEEKPMSPWQ
ncbi:MAG: carboxypeptidase-like regulatory domain-containing protein [Acidobacteriota bacterium]